MNHRGRISSQRLTAPMKLVNGFNMGTHGTSNPISTVTISIVIAINGGPGDADSSPSLGAHCHRNCCARSMKMSNG